MGGGRAFTPNDTMLSYDKRLDVSCRGARYENLASQAWFQLQSARWGVGSMASKDKPCGGYNHHYDS